MFCPNCGSKLTDYYCEHCGYMKNGHFIRVFRKKDDNVLSYYFGNRYDYYVRNRNWPIVGLLGPVYILSHKFYIVGLFLLILDISISLGVLVLNHMFFFTSLIRFFSILYIILNRFFWSSVGNMIYLRLLSKKLYKEKVKHPDKYKQHLQDYYVIDMMFFKTKCIIYGSVSLIIFVILREIIYTYFSLT